MRIDQVLTGLALALVTTAALAHGGATGVVKERMDAMEELGKATKGLAAMARGRAPFEPDAAAALAETIEAHGGDALTELFPEDSISGPSEALPEIWEEWEEFARLAEDLEAQAIALQEVAAAEDVEAFQMEFRETTQLCLDCHEQFREKK